MGRPRFISRGLGRSLGVPLPLERFEHEGYSFWVTLGSPSGLPLNIVKPPPAVLGRSNMLEVQDLAGPSHGLLSWTAFANSGNLRDGLRLP